jgi:hypothetical protein
MWHKLWRRRCLLRETACCDVGCGAVPGRLPVILTACRRCVVWLSKGGGVSVVIVWAMTPCSRYLPTDVSEERSGSTLVYLQYCTLTAISKRSQFRSLLWTPHAVFINIALSLHVDIILFGNSFCFTHTVPHRPLFTCRVSRHTQFCSVCSSYVAVMFCVFTEGDGIVCLPLAEWRHI